MQTVEMGTAAYLWTLILLGPWIIHSSRSQDLPAVTQIDCLTGTSLTTLSQDENYEGDVERISLDVTAVGSVLALESPSCGVCLSFLELSYSVGSTSATVRTTKQLDAEELLADSLSYSIVCTGSAIRHDRIITVNDVNEFAPEFDKDLYLAEVSEFAISLTIVAQVHAVDKDASPDYNTVFYSIEPPSDTFYMLSSGIGHIYLEKRLNSSATTLYELNIVAKDPGDLSSNTTVRITVVVEPGPYFQHSSYNASIPENEVVPNLVVDPSPVVAFHGDNTTVQTILYSIHTVTPSEYSEAFVIDKNTAAIGVKAELDREKASEVQLVLRASYELYPHKTADVQLLVQVEDVNEAPVFNQPLYTSNIVSTVPLNYLVVKVKATDPDVGETEALLYSLAEPSTMFAIEPSGGQVYVVSDIRPGTQVTLKVEATDPHGLFDSATVEVFIKAPDNVVQISINKPSDTVLDKVQDMQKALERALGLQVTIVSVMTDSGGNAVVSFIAMETSGAVVPSEDVKNELIEKKQEVNEELQAVFGADADFDIVDEGKGTGTDIGEIVGIVVGAIAAVAAIGAIVYGAMKIPTRPKRRKSQISMNDTVNFDKRRDSQLSMNDTVNFNKRGSQSSMNDTVNFNK